MLCFVLHYRHSLNPGTTKIMSVDVSVKLRGQYIGCFVIGVVVDGAWP